MENQQTMTSEEQLQKQLEEKNATDHTDRMIMAQYMGKMQIAHMLMNNPKSNKMTARNIQRALFAAIDAGATDSKINYQNKREAELAGVLASAIELSMLIKANNFKKREEENGTSKEENVVAGAGHTTQE